MTRRSILSGLVALGLTLSMSVSARAQDAAAFYRGKTVHFVVGLGVGGGFDAYARMIAPYLGQELGANVVVDNLPGAGGLLALNQIYTAQGDGLRLLIVNGTPAGLGQLIEQDNSRYDLAKFDHLGVISAYPWIWLASKQSGIKSVADAFEALNDPGLDLDGMSAPVGGRPASEGLRHQLISAISQGRVY